MVTNHRHTRPARIVLAEDDRATAHLPKLMYERLDEFERYNYDGEPARRKLEQRNRNG